MYKNLILSGTILLILCSFQIVLAKSSLALLPSLVVDPAYTSNISSSEVISKVWRQPTGKYIIQTGTGFYRLNADLTVDTAFHQAIYTSHTGSPGFNVQVRGLFQNGDLLVTGWFHKVDGVTKPYIARLDANGNLVPSFTINFYPYSSPQPSELFLPACNIYEPTITIHELKFQPGTDQFTFRYEKGPQCPSNNSVPYTVNGIQKYDWVTMINDTVFPIPYPSNGTAPFFTFVHNGNTYTGSPYYGHRVMTNTGEIFIKGQFDKINGVPRTGLAKLDVNGNVLPFNPVLTGGSGNAQVLQIVDNPYNGKLLITTSFDKVNGVNLVASYNISGTNIYTAYLNPNGTLDTQLAAAYNPEAINQYNGQPTFAFLSKNRFLTSYPSSGGDIVRGGALYNGTKLKNMATTNGLILQIREISTSNGPRVLIAGNFSMVNGTPTKSIVMLKPQ